MQIEQLERPFVAYISHSAASMHRIREYQEDIQSRRSDLRFVNPFYDISNNDEDRTLVEGRVVGKRIILPEGYAGRIVDTNIDAIIGAEGHVTFNTQKDTIGSDMETPYALLFNRKPVVNVFDDERNVYRIHPWLSYHSDQTFQSRDAFEEGIAKLVKDAREGVPLRADRARFWIGELLRRQRKEIPWRFTFYLAHATLNMQEVREWELGFEARHQDIDLKNPFKELQRGELDELIIEKMNRGELTEYPKNYDRDIVHKDVDSIANDCDGMIVVVKNYTIGGDMEIMYGNLLRKNPIIAVCSSNMIDHPWIKFHTDYQFSSLEECEDKVPEIVARVRRREKNERLAKYYKWLRKKIRTVA